MDPQEERRGKACVACKQQRRRCKPDCVFALHFHDDPESVSAVVRLYGYTKTANLLKKIEPDFRDDAAKSLLWEAKMRRRFPVHGCLSCIYDLQEQITQETKKLDQLQAILERQHANNANPQGNASGIQQHALPLFPAANPGASSE